ncbi:MAG: LytR C-terminal domain-containing protein [Geodermatophilaceae bacterium]|nr:LytR C-terminal domain-containing protein [Geodermatophilaceae bacterium]
MRRAGRRRPIPALLLLLVLGLVALGVWWQVLQKAEADSAAPPPPAPPCAPLTPAPDTVDPAAVEVRVYNASDQRGLAAIVGAELGERRLRVIVVGNDPSAQVVEGSGEIRYGTNGRVQALWIAANFPRMIAVADARPGSVIDIALGPAYDDDLTPVEEVQRAYEAVRDAAVHTPGADCT